MPLHYNNRPYYHHNYPRDRWAVGLGAGLAYGLVAGLTPPLWYAPPPMPVYYPASAWYWWDGAPIPAGYMLLSDGWVVPYGTPLRPGVFVRRRHGWIRDYMEGGEQHHIEAEQSKKAYEDLAAQRDKIDSEMREMRKKGQQQQQQDALVAAEASSRETAPAPAQAPASAAAYPTRARRVVKNPLLSEP